MEEWEEVLRRAGCDPQEFLEWFRRWRFERTGDNSLPVITVGPGSPPDDDDPADWPDPESSGHRPPRPTS